MLLAFSSNLGTIRTAKYPPEDSVPRLGRRVALRQPPERLTLASTAAGRRGRVKDSMGCIIPIRDGESGRADVGRLPSSR